MDLEPSQPIQDGDESLNSLPEDSFEYEQGVGCNIILPNRLREHMQFWCSIDTSQFILDFTRAGYCIPFHSTPPRTTNWPWLMRPLLRRLYLNC